MAHTVITIARQYGSGGKTVGRMLSEDLGIHFYNREILRLASDARESVNRFLAKMMKRSRQVFYRELRRRLTLVMFFHQTAMISFLQQTCLTIRQKLFVS